MKRFSAIVILCCMLLPLAACSFFSGADSQPVLFFYRRAEYLLGQEDGVISSEERDGTGHITDIAYLLRLYLMGPMDEDLVSPFPEGLQILDVRLGTDTVVVTLSNELDTLTEAQQTLACACLALTCMDISGEESVTLAWDGVILVMDPDTLTLSDNSSLYNK